MASRHGRTSWRRLGNKAEMGHKEVVISRIMTLGLKDRTTGVLGRPFEGFIAEEFEGI